MTFPDLVAAELQSARAEHGPHHSLHESYGIILEELDEFWAEVKRKEPCKERLVAELVQVAASCQRCAEDLTLVKQAYSDRQSLLDTIQIQDAEIQRLRAELQMERERSESLNRTVNDLLNAAWHYWYWRCLWKMAAKRKRQRPPEPMYGTVHHAKHYR